MKMLKKTASIIAIGALTVSLTACGITSKKYTFDEVYSKLESEKYYESNMDFAINVKGEGLSPEDQSIVDVINKSKLTAHLKHDGELKQDEIAYGVKVDMGAMKIDMEIPMLVDSKNEKAYIKTQSIVDQFGVSLPELKSLFEEAGGTILELDLKSDSTEEYAAELSKFEKELTKKVKAVVKESGDKAQSVDVTKEEKEKGVKQKLKVVFTKEQIKGLAVDAVTEINNVIGEEMSKEDLADMKKDLEKIGLQDAQFIVSIDKNGRILNENFVMSLKVNEKEYKGDITLTVNSQYTKYGVKPTLSIDPVKEKDQIIAQDKLEQLVNEFESSESYVEEGSEMITEEDLDAYRYEVSERLFAKIEPQLTGEEKKVLTPETLSVVFIDMTFEELVELDMEIDTMDPQDFLDGFRSTVNGTI